MRRLLLAAAERETERVIIPEGAWSAESASECRKVPTLGASASYQRAAKLAKRLACTDEPRQLLELHDILAHDPMADMGFSGIKEVYDGVRSRIVEQFRRKAFPAGGWGFG